MIKMTSYINDKRDFYIDFMRFLGLSLIILVHVGCPDWLKQVRCFDVPLMVFVSGLSCTYKKENGVWNWLWKRFKRLVIPTYIFFSAYIIMLYLWDLHSTNNILDRDSVIGTYFMLNNPSVGYIYIIRVFLLVMICTPLLLAKCKIIKNKWGGVLLIAGLLFLFLEICLRNITIPDSGITGIFYNQFIIYAIAYSIPFLVGYSVRYLVKERVRLMTLIVLLVLIISAVVYYLSNGLPFEITPLYKYPPHAYYIIYGCCISALLYCLRFLRPVQNAVEKMKMPVFIGQNTIWIYFWHIPWLLVVGIFVHQWVISFVLVYILSVTTYILQYRIVAKVNKQFFNKYFVG